MNPIARWLRTTFDYNPAFPLSALALLVGVRLLADEGGVQSPLGEALISSGILQAYEVLLLGVALLVLWPRKVTYETTAILIILGVVRFAAPFMAARLAGEGQLTAALALGLVTWLMSTAKVEVAARRLGLDWTWRERLWDAVLFGVGCVALPLLAERLATQTGLELSHSASRGLQLATWWTLAALLAPLAMGRESLGEPGALRSRRPALVWRAVTFAGVGLLACNALWIGGDLPRPLALVPLILAGIAVGSHVVRAWGGEVWPHFAHLPALFLAVGAFGGELLSRGLPLSSTQALALLAIPCALSLPLLVRERHYRRQGARSLALVAAAAPLPALPSSGVLAYGLLISLLFFAWNLHRRRDLFVAGAMAAAAVLLYLLGAQLPGVAGWGVVATLAICWREPEGEVAQRVAYVLTLAPGLACLLAPPSLTALACFSAAAGAAALLAHRQRDLFMLRVACLGLALPLGRKLTVGASPAHLLLGAAFGGIPLGTWLALRREARAREADADLLTDPRFEEPTLPTRPLQEAA
jgi:hypothetical protein